MQHSRLHRVILLGALLVVSLQAFDKLSNLNFNVNSVFLRGNKTIHLLSSIHYNGSVALYLLSNTIIHENCLYNFKSVNTSKCM